MRKPGLSTIAAAMLSGWACYWPLGLALLLADLVGRPGPGLLRGDEPPLRTGVLPVRADRARLAGEGRASPSAKPPGMGGQASGGRGHRWPGNTAGPSWPDLLPRHGRGLSSPAKSSQHPAIGKAERCLPRQNHVVEHLDPEKVPGLLQAAGHVPVTLRGLQAPARVVVGHDDGG